MDELMVTIPIEEYKEMLGKIYDYNALMRYLYRCQDERIEYVNSSKYTFCKDACQTVEIKSEFVDMLTGSDLLREIELKRIKKEEPASEDTDSNE